MVKDTIKIISTTAELLLLVLISACANQLPPGGGDIDKTPPEIVDVYPANGTTNFNDNHIELEFSEYITKSSLNDVLFISPAINGKLDFNWTGKSVDINFPERLKKNATYVVTVGTDVEDYNNKNKMRESYTFTFSTGNEIDRRTISGKVYNGKPSGVMIFAYKKGTNDINPLKDKPDYISQAGNDGAYKIAGLAEGKYRLFAIRDKYKDLLYQPSQDEYGCPSSDVTLAKSDSSLSGINFMLTERDTIPPRLLSATMTDEHHLLVGFTKGIDSTLIESDNFFLTDSTTNNNIMVGSAFKGTAKPAEIVLTIKNTISLNDDVYLIAKRLKDKYGNVFASDFVRLTISDRADTSKPGILKTIPPNNFINADYIKQKFIFYFTDSFDTTSARAGISLTDTSGNIYPYEINYMDDATFTIVPAKNLDKVKDYMIKLYLNKFKNQAGNSFDSTYIYKFRTISGIDFTGISGKLEKFELSKNPKLILERTESGKKKYEQKISANGKFNFTRIEPGKYNLWCYYDTDDNGEYSYGSVYPFIPAEEFFVYSETFTLKPRWTLTDVNFSIKK